MLNFFNIFPKWITKKVKRVNYFFTKIFITNYVLIKYILIKILMTELVTDNEKVSTF
jgi:hypothetical protein